MQQLRDKLAITERAAKSEAQLKVILRLILIIVSEGTWEPIYRGVPVKNK